MYTGDHYSKDDLDEGFAPNEEFRDVDLGYKFGAEDSYVSLLERAHAHSSVKKYDPAFCEIAFRMSRSGADNRRIAEALSVTRQTINNWQKTYPRFASAIKLGKIVAVANVADAAYKLATGYKVVKTKLFSVPQTSGGSAVEAHRYVDVVPPNQKSIEYFLNNRAPDEWSSSSTVDVKNNGGSFASAAAHLATEEILAQAAALDKVEEAGD